MRHFSPRAYLVAESAFRAERELVFGGLAIDQKFRPARGFGGNQSAGISMTGVAGHAFLLARGNTIDNNFGGIYSDVLGGGAVATIKDNVIHDGLDGVTIGHGGVATIANNAVSLVSTGVNVAAGGATVRSATNNLFSDTGEDVHGGTLTSILPK